MRKFLRYEGNYFPKTFEVKDLQNPMFIPTIVNWRDMVTNLTILGNGRL